MKQLTAQFENILEGNYLITPDQNEKMIQFFLEEIKEAWYDSNVNVNCCSCDTCQKDRDKGFENYLKKKYNLDPQ